jgi:SET domain-containing protein
MAMSVGIMSDPDTTYASDSDDSYSEDKFLAPRRRSSTCSAKSQPTVIIDARRAGNWTRFINHSCDSRADFRVCRVGGMRVMVIEASRNIPAGVELTVNYGEECYGKESRNVCFCGAKKCVGRDRR